MGFLGFLGSSVGQLVVTAGLDLAASLLGGGKSAVGPRLADKNVNSQNYGTPWPRCRGTVRLVGKVIQSTKKMEVLHKRVSGGFLGIGMTSEYFYTYSANLVYAFGKRLGGGAAARILKLWANGKLLYGSEVTDATLSGGVTVQVGTPAASVGDTIVPIVTDGTGSASLPAGTDISFAAQPGVTYEVQIDFNIGPNSTGFLSIWPPLNIDLGGGGQISVPGLNAPYYDLVAFWPQADTERFQGVFPQSHVDSDPEPDRAGGLHIYLGTDDQLPDPFSIKQLGPNAPGYRGLVNCMLFRLKLTAGFSGEIPQIAAKIAFDDANDVFPFVGPIEGITGSNTTSRNAILLPSGWTELGSGQTLPFIVVTVWPDPEGSSPQGRAYVVSSDTNTLRNSFAIDVSSGGPQQYFLDNDGYLYVQENVSSPRNLYKYDIFTGAKVGELPTTGAPATISADSSWIYDSPLALDPYTNFTKPMRMGLLFAKDSGQVQLFDRGNMIGVGGIGTPLLITGLGGVGAAHIHAAVDKNGDIWIGQSTTLFQCDGKFGAPIPNPLAGSIPLVGAWIIAYPTMAVKRTITLADSIDTMFYDPSDDTIALLLENSHAVKVDIRNGEFTGIGVSNITYPSGMTDDMIGQATDIMGTVVVGAGGSAFIRIPLYQIGVAATIIPIAYHVGDFITSSTGVQKTFDPLTNSIWLINANTDQMLYRIYIDRGQGSGVGLDQVVASLFDEAGYSASQYDVTQLASITVGGVEFGQEPFIQSLRMLAQLYAFDVRETDGKLVCIPRGQLPIDTIPEDDLGALSDPNAYEPRIVESIVDELTLPRKVELSYYDNGRQCQQATQDASRIAQPYASALAGAQRQLNSQEIQAITVPVTDSATAMKKRAEVILYDQWASRKKYDFKTAFQHLLLDPADVILVPYKGSGRQMRITELDFGGGMAIAIKAEENYPDAYTPSDVTSSGGAGSGTQPTPVPSNSNAYTISPASPLSNPNATEIDMAAVTATFASGLRTLYNARAFTITDPGAGNSQIYYVSIYDPTFVGDNPGATNLTALIGTTPESVHAGEAGYVFMGSIVAVGSTGGGTVTTPGGNPPPGAGGSTGGTTGGTGTPVSILTITAPNPGNFSIAHGLGRIPTWAEIEDAVSSAGTRGVIQWASTGKRYDATNLYLDASDTGIQCVIALW